MMAVNTEKLQKLDQLVRQEATGSPKELGETLEMSEAQVKRFIKNLRNEWGYPIGYSMSDKTYYYYEEW